MNKETAKILLPLCGLAMISALLLGTTLQASGSPQTASGQPQNPRYDHVVVVVEENHGYEQIVGSSNAPYLNNTLIKGGVLITNAYGEQHPSQPNYFWLFSGSNQGINSDSPYWQPGPARPVYSTSNLYTALEQKLSASNPNFFGGYVDSGNQAPVANYYVDTPTYANRHVPWLGFKNIPKGITMDFSKFPSGPDYSSLPTVSFVIPALNHDMHDEDEVVVRNTTESTAAVQMGDSWLRTYLGGYAEWAKTHNSLLIITWDEDSTFDWPTPVNQGGHGSDGGVNPSGMTSPKLGFQASKSTSGPNHIAMIFYGANLITPGPHTLSGTGMNNINLLRTLESFYGLMPSGQQSELAMQAGLTNGPITEIFVRPAKK